MAVNSAIEWTQATWNPVTGCSKISPGCRHCYAEQMTRRLRAMGHPHYLDGFRVRTHADALKLPLKWKKARTIFVNSMSDLFHDDVPDSFIKKAFDTMTRARCHTFQVLTKRSERLVKLSHDLLWPVNIWLGVSVENEDYIPRIDDLRQTPAHVKFVSFEPLLGPIKRVSLRGIDWVIVGGESGSRARPMQKTWVTQLRDVCLQAGVCFFFKQWGGRNKKQAGRLLEGRTWDQMPKIEGNRNVCTMF